MALSVPDITITSADWVELYALTGIPSGTSIRLQNKTIRSAQMFLTDVKPVATATNGELIASYQTEYAKKDIFNSAKIWLRAVSASVTLSVIRDIPTPASGSGSSDGLTNTQLRATAIAVSGPLTDAQLRASAIAITTDGLTNTQLRATALPVTTDGLTNAQLRASAIEVTGPLTNASLRAVDVNVKPVMSTGGNLSVTMNTDAATYVAFGGINARQFTICNNTGFPIEFLQGVAGQAGTGVSFPILDGTYYTIFGITNTSQISVRRADGVTTGAALVIKARWET